MIRPVIGIGADVVPDSESRRERAFGYLTYVKALQDAGAITVLIPPQPESLKVLIERLDGVILAGGDDCDPSLYDTTRHPAVMPMDPRRQANELALARLARAAGIPTLGICLGVQVMNVAAGGSLVQDIASEVAGEIGHGGTALVRRRHDVTIVKGTLLEKILGVSSANVNSAHHQAVERVGHGLRLSARAGDGVIEGLEDPAHPFYVGVQWHPEDMTAESTSRALFGALVEHARTRASARNPKL